MRLKCFTTYNILPTAWPNSAEMLHDLQHSARGMPHSAEMLYVVQQSAHGMAQCG